MNHKMGFKFSIFCFIYFCLIHLSNESRVRQRKHQISDQIDYSGTYVIRVFPENNQQINYLLSLHYNPNVEFWLSPTRLGKAVDIQISPPFAEEFENKLFYFGINGFILIQDIGRKMIKDKQLDAIESYNSLVTVDSFFNDFKDYTKIKSFLRKVNKENMNLTSIESIGKSVEGRDIFCIKIGTNQRSITKPVIYIDGGMHAREWAAVSTACYIIERLIKGYRSGNSFIKHLLKKFDFLIVPVVNPDGYEFTHTVDRMWRKNRAKFDGTDCRGTDLNRNYDFHWGGEGSSHSPCSSIYAGPNAFSEPESKAVSKLILKNRLRIKMYITLHAYGQYFLYPWGWTKDDSPNVVELKRVADIGHKALNTLFNTTYTVGSPAQIMYIAQGSDDWAHGFAQIPYVYCLEMRDLGKNGFLLPRSEIIPVGRETFAAVKAMARAILST